MPDPLSWLDDSLEQLRTQHLVRELRARNTPQAATVELDGQTYHNFGSNDYLGLSSEPRVIAAAVAVAEQAGFGSGASPLVTGRSAWHARLERALAEFKGTAAALLFPSGFAANTGTIPALVGPADTILSDAANHASIIDGCRLSGAHVRIYRHLDLDHLQQLLSESDPKSRRLIVTDSLFSMDGDLAPLDQLAQLAEDQGAMLMVDEAHATGVLGAQGRGAAELLGAEHGIHVRMGTLSKALGSVGGFVAGSEQLIQWLAHRARSFVFSTATPAATAAAALESLEIVRNEPERRRLLLARASRLRSELVARGWQIGRASAQIIPIILGDAQTTMDAAARLRSQGFWVPGIRPPSVPAGQSLLRISLSYLHSDTAIDELLGALENVLITRQVKNAI